MIADQECQLSDVIRRDGFAFLPDVLSADVVDGLVAAIDRRLSSEGTKRHALRRLLTEVDEVRSLARSAAVRAVVEAMLGPGAFAVRGIYFDKLPGANWKVAWHQDLTIAVKLRREVPGFGPWSVKDGIAHVEPPPELLERMLTLRIHLDDCDEGNGPLRVVAGSHRLGRLTAGAVESTVASRPATACLAPRGGAVVMRPLILHASSPAQAPRHRRVIHIEFAAEELPGELDWHDRVA